MKWLLFCIAWLLIVSTYMYLQSQPKQCNLAYVELPHAQTVKAELAVTPAEQQRGLAFRDSLGRNEGMLFLFNKAGVYPFWMKDTRIPLDIIWINQQTVVDMTTLEPPAMGDEIPTYTPAQAATTVLEINAHQAQQVGLKIGDTITWDISCRSSLR